MTDYWETHIVVVDASQIRHLDPGETLTIEGLWFTAEEYVNHNHDLPWPTVSKVTMVMDEYENITIVYAPVVDVAGVGYRILD